jgi:hypothetical protein
MERRRACGVTIVACRSSAAVNDSGESGWVGEIPEHLREQQVEFY